MLCLNCGKEFSEQYTACPNCGWEAPAEESAAEPEKDMEVILTAEPEEAAAEEPLEPEKAEADAAEEAEETEGSEEAGMTVEIPSEPEGPEPLKKKKSILPVVLAAIVGLLLIIVVCLSVVVTTLSKTGSMPGFVTTVQNLFHREHFDGDATAARILGADGTERAVMNNEQLSFYYWGEFYYYIQNAGLNFDTTQPLSEQNYSDEMSWQDYFLENAKASIQQVEGLKAAAEADGFTMPEQYQTEYDNTIASMADYAAQAGFTDEDGNGDVLAYVRDSYGSGATEESFRAYLYDSYFVTAYSDSIYENVTVEEGDLESFYDENAEMYESYGVVKSDLPNVNVRHILIESKTADEEGEEEPSDEEQAKADQEAEAEAQRILKEWEDGDATEESFGELANTYSTDPGSNTTGGLYENVFPGQMVEEFNDWCFDSSRKPGDTGIVKTDYGYHIMYYVGTTDVYYWKQAVESDLRYERYDEALQEIVDQVSVEYTEDLEIATPTSLSTLSEQAAPAEQ